jgi:hypothetical protein
MSKALVVVMMVFAAGTAEARAAANKHGKPTKSGHHQKHHRAHAHHAK